VEEPNAAEVQRIAGEQNEAALKAGEALADRLNDPNAFRKVSEERGQNQGQFFLIRTHLLLFH